MIKVTTSQLSYLLVIMATLSQRVTYETPPQPETTDNQPATAPQHHLFQKTHLFSVSFSQPFGSVFQHRADLRRERGPTRAGEKWRPWYVISFSTGQTCGGSEDPPERGRSGDRGTPNRRTCDEKVYERVSQTFTFNTPTGECNR